MVRGQLGLYVGEMYVLRSSPTSSVLQHLAAAGDDGARSAHRKIFGALAAARAAVSSLVRVSGASQTPASQFRNVIFTKKLGPNPPLSFCMWAGF